MLTGLLRASAISQYVVASSSGKIRVVFLLDILVALTSVLCAAPVGTARMNPQDGLTYQWIPSGSYYTGCLPNDTECYGLNDTGKKSQSPEASGLAEPK